MERVKKISALFVLATFLLINTTLYLSCKEDRYSKVPTYVINSDGAMPLDKFIALQEKEVKLVKRVDQLKKEQAKVKEKRVVKAVKVTPSHFTTDQKQQKEKLDKLTETQYGQEVFRYAHHSSIKYGVDMDLILAIVMTESGFNQYAKNGNSYGLMQLSDNTEASKMCSNLYNTKCNIDASTKHFAGLQAKYKGNTRLALAAYNAGGGAVDSSLRRTGDIPKCTHNYVYKVRKYREVIRTYEFS